MDAKNHHLHKPVMIGEIQADGQFQIVWKTDGPVEPLPEGPGPRPEVAGQARQPGVEGEVVDPGPGDREDQRRDQDVERRADGDIVISCLRYTSSPGRRGFDSDSASVVITTQDGSSQFKSR